MDFNKFFTWCSENGYNPSDISAKEAYEAAHNPKTSTRKHERKQVTILCIGHEMGPCEDGSEPGERLFKRATVPNLKSVKSHTAWVLTGEAAMSGLENPYCVVVGERLELD